MVMANAMLTLHGVEVRRGMNIVLRDFHLTAEAGEILALVGENGSGKSTVLEAAAGLLPLEKGEVRHAEVAILDSDGRRRRSLLNIGCVLQKNGMIGSEVVDEHLRLACSKSGSLVDFSSLLEAFKLQHRSQDLVAHLSQGQARKVAVLAGLLPAFASKRPALLLLDEPSTGFDDDAVETLAQLLCQLRQAGHCIVMCTHDERLVAIATQILDVKSGEEIRQDAHDIGEHIALESMPTRPISPMSFGMAMHARTMLWLNTNGIAALLALGVFVALGDFMTSLNDMQRLGFLLIPALAAGFCGDGLVGMLREERASTWWKAIGSSHPHAGPLPIVLGAIITLISSVALQQDVQLQVILLGAIICFTVWHLVRFLQQSTQRLARPHAVFVGLLTPLMLLPFAILVEWAS